MPNGISKEYILLFNALSCLKDDLCDVQVFLMRAGCRIDQLCCTGKEEDLDKVLSLTFYAGETVITRLQELQQLIMMAQQNAEDYYISAIE